MNARALSHFLGPVLLLLVGVMGGCRSAETTTAPTPSTEAAWSEVPLTLTSVAVQGDDLVAVVQYSGGCGEHTLHLEANGPMLKSLPPKQPLRVVHRSFGDPCRAMIVDTLVAPLTSFRGTPRGTTVLMLEGWEENLYYAYP